MTTMNISLPEEMKTFVETQVQQGGYSTASEYLRELIRDAQKKRKAQERLEKLIQEGIESGPGIEVTPEYWAERRQELERRLSSRRESQ